MNAQDAGHGPRVRLLHRVVLVATSEGLDFERLRTATRHVRDGDDVVVCVRGCLDFEPTAARYLGQSLAMARTITVEAAGPGARAFVGDLMRGAHDEAALL